MYVSYGCIPMIPSILGLRHSILGRILSLVSLNWGGGGGEGRDSLIARGLKIFGRPKCALFVNHSGIYGPTYSQSCSDVSFLDLFGHLHKAPGEIFITKMWNVRGNYRTANEKWNLVYLESSRLLPHLWIKSVCSTFTDLSFKFLMSLNFHLVRLHNFDPRWRLNISVTVYELPAPL